MSKQYYVVVNYGGVLFHTVRESETESLRVYAQEINERFDYRDVDAVMRDLRNDPNTVCKPCQLIVDGH